LQDREERSDPYFVAYRLKHNRDFDETRRVPNVTLAAIAQFEGKWEKIIFCSWQH
jgi:hypothetical protein